MGNCIKDARESHALTRDQLARMIGVTRQSIALMETGRMYPGTQTALRLARALGRRVEELFWEQDPEPADEITLYPEQSDMRTDLRAYLTAVGGRRLARIANPTSADSGPPAHVVIRRAIAGSVDEHGPKIQPFATVSSLPDTVFVSGCDLGLSVLTQHVTLQSQRCQGIWFNVTNARALAELQDGVTHIAAVHLPAEQTLADLKLSCGVTAFHFARAQLGWVMRRGNPRSFCDAEQLRHQALRLVNRPQGAGARALLDCELQRAHVDVRDVAGYDFEVSGHFDVADAIAKGFADVGVAHAGAAARLGLDFTALQAEHCSLLIRADAMASDAVQALIHALQSDRFRAELSAIGPYDTDQSGNRCH